MDNFFHILVITKNKRLIGTILITFATFLLVACDNANKSDQPSPDIAVNYNKATKISGLVREEKDHIKSGKIIVTDYNNKRVVTAQIDDTAHYSVSIPANTTYPLEITAYPGSGQSKLKTLKVAVIAPPLPTYDITPTTTAIAKQARSFGGYTYKNLVRAARNTVADPGRDKTVEGFRGDYTKQYGGWH